MRKKHRTSASKQIPKHQGVTPDLPMCRHILGLFCLNVCQTFKRLTVQQQQDHCQGSDIQLIFSTDQSGINHLGNLIILLQLIEEKVTNLQIYKTYQFLIIPIQKRQLTCLLHRQTCNAQDLRKPELQTAPQGNPHSFIKHEKYGISKQGIIVQFLLRKFVVKKFQYFFNVLQKGFRLYGNCHCLVFSLL